MLFMSEVIHYSLSNLRSTETLENVHTFSHQKFLKNKRLPLDHMILMNRNQVLKLLLVAAVVDLVIYLNL